jgi:hypothetical protein
MMVQQDMVGGARTLRTLLETGLETISPEERLLLERCLPLLERAGWLLSLPGRCGAVATQEFAKDGSLDSCRWQCSRLRGHERYDEEGLRPHCGAEETTGEIREWSDEVPAEVTVKASELEKQSREEAEADELFASMHAREVPAKTKKGRSSR